jgi:hypothetical protein
MERGLIKRPKLIWSIPLGSSSPYLGVFRVKPTVQKVETLVGRILDTHSIAERGFKSRIITVSDWEYPVLAHYLLTVQQRLMSFDKTVPSLTGEMAAEGTRKLFVNYYKKPWGHKVETDEYHSWLRRMLLSTDLSRCSDLILPSLNRALLEGFNEGADFYSNSFLRHISTLLYAKRTITYKKGDEEILPDLHDARLSPLMGDPSTWITNNLFTKLAVFFGRFKYHLPEEERQNYIEILDRMSDDDLLEAVGHIGIAAFCGDDVLADVTDELEAQLIKLTFEELGGKISDGTDILSEDKAIFCENIFTKGFLDGQGPYLEYQDMIKIKQMTRPQTSESFETVPPSWVAGINSEKSLKYIDRETEEGMEKYNILQSVIVHNNHKFLQDCKRFGLKPFFPVKLGGVGYPVNPDKFSDYSSSSVEEKLLFSMLESASFEDLTPIQLYELVTLQDIFTKYNEATLHGFEDSESIRAVLERCLYLPRSDIIQLVNSQYKAERPWRKRQLLRTRVDDPTDGSIWIPFRRFIKLLRNRLISNRGLLFDPSVVRDPPGLSDLKEVFDQKWRSLTAALGTGTQQQHCITNASLSADWDCIKRLEALISGLDDQFYIELSIINDTNPKLTKDIPWNV